MKLLAIDTATEACSAALLVDDAIDEEFEIAPRRHAELILPMVNTLLLRAGLRLTDLDALAFGRGPGAFTGLRIAAGVTQGLAFAAGLAIIPVSTLAALALNGDQETERLLCAIDARMGEVYWCTYAMDAEGMPAATGAEQVSAPDSVSIPDDGRYFGIGTGWKSYADVLRKVLGAGYAGCDGDRYPRARDILALARVEYAAGRSLAAEEAIPVYLRDRVTK
jgi:tRNA threonylcarbamoyladenosine biosynthesis protein TsaB